LAEQEAVEVLLQYQVELEVLPQMAVVMVETILLQQVQTEQSTLVAVEVAIETLQVSEMAAPAS
jgi:hypothetical protein